MAIECKYEPGQLVEIRIDGVRYVGLVLSASRATHRGKPPMLKVEWVGDPPRDYPVEYVTEQGLKLVK